MPSANLVTATPCPPEMVVAVRTQDRCRVHRCPGRWEDEGVPSIWTTISRSAKTSMRQNSMRSGSITQSLLHIFKNPCRSFGKLAKEQLSRDRCRQHQERRLLQSGVPPERTVRRRRRIDRKSRKLFQTIAQDVSKEGLTEKRVTHKFEKPTVIRTSSLLVPTIEIESISADIKIEQGRAVSRARISNFAEWLLHDLNTNKTHWFAVTPSVIAQLSKE